MRKLIFSKYSFFVEHGLGGILYSSKTGKHILLTEVESNFVKHAFEVNTLEGVEENLVHQLYVDGYIVDGDTDEYAQITDMRAQFLNDNGLFLMILPTEQCNFRCVYCYEIFQRDKMTCETIENIKQFVAEKLAFCNKLTVAWFGGEPMLAMDIVNNLSQFFLEECRKQRKPYFSTITTNGSLLTPENWKYLKKNHITNYQITIDGLETTHNRQRRLLSGGETWNTVVDNLRYFRDNIHSKIFSIALRTNITREIYEKRDEYLDFLMREFGRDSRFHFFFHLAEDWGNIDDGVRGLFCGPDELYNVLGDAAQKGLSLKLHEFFTQPGNRICFAAKRNAYLVSSEGVLRKCSGHLYKDYNYILDLNNPLDINTDNICYWDFEYKSIPIECRECKMLPLCFGLVCPAYHGRVSETCGNDLMDMNRMIDILFRT